MTKTPTKKRKIQNLWCSVSSCSSGTVKGAKYCWAHYSRLRNTGSLRIEEPVGYRNHGQKKNKSSTYRSWLMMNNRCSNVRAMDYSYYGGKGIQVCPRWRRFQNFQKDMGEKPSAEYTIGRIDSSLGYEKKNCRWETRKDQARNRKFCKLSLEKAYIIRLLYQTGFSQKELGELFRVGISTISSVVNGKTWS